MCGIWGVFGTECEVYKYISCFFEIKHRGLDCFRFENMKHFENIALGFHRLAFHDPVSGMQPMKLLSIPHIVMIYNGEIYNFSEVYYIKNQSNYKKNFLTHLNLIQLIEKHNFKFETCCDGEILVHLYNKGGIEFMCQNLYGVYGFILLDLKLNKIFVGRDTYGVRPLYKTFNPETGTLGVCSEVKGLIGLKFNAPIEPVLPGTFDEYDLVINPNNKERKEKKMCKLLRSHQYHKIGDFPKYDINLNLTEDVYENIRKCFTNAVKKRIFGERRIGCLLSGGLGSSLVCGILAQELKKNSETDYPILTFSIGMGVDSHDLLNAKTVSKYLGTEHHEITFTKEEATGCLREVIRITESYDKITIRDAIVMYLLSKYIQDNTDVRCIFSGILFMLALF